MCKISIIIPVFNCEKYISFCLDSILKQTSRNYEIIIINDGSNDSTYDVIKPYLDKYNFIKIINQVNLGVSIARNKGISLAKGEWIVFVDGDDLLHKNFCEIINNISDKNLDILFFDVIKICNHNFNEDNLDYNLEYTIYTFNEKIKLIKNVLGFTKGNIEIDNLKNVWAKGYRRELLINNNICFPEGVKNGEDMIFNIRCLDHFKKAKYIKFPLYYYYHNNESVTNRYKPDIDEITNKFYDELDKVLINKHEYSYEYNMNIINNYFLEMNHYLFHKDNKLRRYDRFEEFKNRTKRNFYLDCFKNVNFNDVINILGVKKYLIIFFINLKLYLLVYSIFNFKLIYSKLKKGNLFNEN